MPTDSPTLPLDRVIHGDCLEILPFIPENSVDLVFADPPYNLQLAHTLYRPNMSKVDAVDDEWDHFGSFEEYDRFTRQWLAACRRVLKDTGTLWVIGSYHNIYRIGTILMDLGYWILNDVVWVKCLAGDTELLALINGRPIVSNIKDLVRIDLAKNTIELPSYDEEGRLTWVDITSWQKVEKSRGLRLEFEDGAAIECTGEHRFPVIREGLVEMRPAEDLAVGDAILELGRFDVPDVVAGTNIDRAVGEFVGWYLAEGSMLADNKGVQLSMGAKERPQAEVLLELIRDKLGIVGRIHIYRNSLHLVLPGQFMVAFVQRFVRGGTAKTKRLAREAFFYGKEFLAGIFSGYLQGDGHWDETNQRWRVGLTRNDGLISDLRVICRLLGGRLHAKPGTIPYQRTRVEIIRGEIRANDDDQWSYVTLEELGLPPRRHFGQGQRHSLARLRNHYKLTTRKNPIAQMTGLAEQVLHGDLRLTRIAAIHNTTLKTFYDLSVSGNHVFALANGVLTHNSNPMPNFRGVRFTNAHETLLWAQKQRGASYTFNHHVMKALNDELQMRSDWEIPLCTGKERLRVDGQKAHPTQKPEALLYRVILSSSNPGDVVLDPFFGTGTTGAVAKKLHRRFIGIEREKRYVSLAEQRIEEITPMMFADEVFSFEKKRELARIPFGALLEQGLIQPGQKLYFGPKGRTAAIVLANGQIKLNGCTGSIHAVGRQLQNAPCNGWEHWYYIDDQTGARLPLDTLRAVIREAGKPQAKKKVKAAHTARKRRTPPKRRRSTARHKRRRRA